MKETKVRLPVGMTERIEAIAGKNKMAEMIRAVLEVALARADVRQYEVLPADQHKPAQAEASRHLASLLRQHRDKLPDPPELLDQEADRLEQVAATFERNEREGL